MDHYYVIGNPVAHSRSPWIHARFAELTGEVLHYDRRLVALDGFAHAIGKLREHGVRGSNVTVPFKFEAFAAATLHTERAALAGACNTLKFLEGDALLGDNTDGVGLVYDIEHNAGHSIAGHRVLLIGAGGAAAGVLGPLIGAHPAAIVIANRTLAKAQALVASHAAWAALHGVTLLAKELHEAGHAFDFVINGTASSLNGDAIPVPDDVLRADTVAYDMMYGPSAQGFLRWARNHGAEPRDGLGMLVEQAAESFLLWRGVRPPSAPVLAEVRALVDAS